MVSTDKLAKLLGVADDNAYLEFALTDAKNIILGYCHIDTIPSRLETTCYRMAMDIFRNEKFGEDGELGRLSSLTEGDVSISYGQRYDEIFTASLLKNYKAQLNPFRKLVFKNAT